MVKAKIAVAEAMYNLKLFHVTTITSLLLLSNTHAFSTHGFTHTHLADSTFVRSFQHIDRTNKCLLQLGMVVNGKDNNATSDGGSSNSIGNTLSDGDIKPTSENLESNNVIDSGTAPFQTDTPYLQIAKEEVIGIGGRSGKNSSNYDVNKLKNNLVQKSIRQFKKELLFLLMETDTSTTKNRKHNLRVEEKLAALISANPVATTTDSNLLEGSWELAFATSNASEILDEARFLYSRKKEKLSPQRNEKGDWKLTVTKVDNPLHTYKRSIYLEELEEDEDPFMMDSILLFRGLWTIHRFYDIVGLTRTNLELVPISKSISFCGRQIFNKRADEKDLKTKDLSLIYLDSDICVSMTGGDKDNLQVYTKNKIWIESRREKGQLLKSTLTWLNSIESPLKIRRKISSVLHSEEEPEDDGELGKLTEEEYEILLRRVYDDKESKLMALRLGDYGSDSEDIDEGAWGGKDDPFVHLSADERQVIMKQMSIGEIKKAGYIQRRFAKKNKKRRSSTQVFKRPDSEEPSE